MDTNSLGGSSISEKEYMQLRDYIYKSSGILIPPEKVYLMETRLSKHMLDAGASTFGEFYHSLVSQPNKAMRQKIINAMTTNETLWFRDAAPWKVLENDLLPKLVDDLASGRKQQVRIWFSAVSTGQEAYSTVMCINDYLRKHRIEGVKLSDFDFFATDISTNVLDIAARGRYDKISIMRGLSDSYRTRYFSVNGSAWDIAPEIRDAVRFAPFNLQNTYLALGLFDIIFCRYVLIYFSESLRKEVIDKMHGALTDGGVLFTGNYVLYDLFEEGFQAGYCENATYYTKKSCSLRP